jgi:pimeloyl-ACP methyl ester carboxylesterase
MSSGSPSRSRLLSLGPADCASGSATARRWRVWATQPVTAGDPFASKTENAAWKSKPNWYIVAEQYRTVQPELERCCAQRMGATTYEADNSHLVMLSNPGLVTDVIRTAANSVQGS